MLILILSVFIFFNLIYLISLKKQDFGIVDIAWGLSFILIFGIGVYNSNEELKLRGMILTVLVCSWGLRLSSYILYRKKNISGEDYRYAQWRKDWGRNANFTAYFKVFLLQAFLSLIIASPLYIFHQFSEQKSFGTTLDYIGLSIWCLGFYFQAVSDFQKHIFKSQNLNEGKICQVGLWKYSRHPNYFGEALIWWGTFFIIIHQVPIYFAIPGPLVIHFFLLKVSGVALLEKKYDNNKEYEDYSSRTNAFIPWIPRA